MITPKLIVLPILAAFITAVLIPIVRRFSIRIGNVDQPRQEVRKLHSYTVPLGAGIAIFIGFLLTTLLAGNFSTEIIGLLVAGAFLIAVGVLDELYDISSLSRILSQIIAAGIVIYSGVRVDFIGNFGSGNDGLFFLKSLSVPFTLCWIVGVTNAIRILDGIDGLCAGVTGIAAWTMGIVAVMTGRPEAATLSFILGAVAFAYLPYNFSTNPKRKIFMAESGSTFLGFALAMVAIMGSVKTAAAFSMLVPIIALIYPIFDIVFAVGRRLAAGKSPFKADGMHLHHRLLKMGLNHRQATCVFYVATIALGILAISSTQMDGRSVIYVFVATLAIFILLLWKFGLICFSRKR